MAKSTKSTARQHSPVAPPTEGTTQLNVGTVERVLSVAAAGVLGYLGVQKLRDESPTAGAAMLTGSAALLYRGASGNCPVNTAIGRNSAEAGTTKAVEINRTVIVQAPREEVYAFWRKLENLPRFMDHLAEVQQIDQRHSHWEAKIPAGLGATISWDAEIVQEVANERLLWRSLPGSTIDNAGEVHFRNSPDGRGTEVHAIIAYRPPAGEIGKAVAGWLNPTLSNMVKDDMRRFKELVESGKGDPANDKGSYAGGDGM